MSVQSHKSDFLILAVLGLLTAFVLLVLISYGIIKQDRLDKAYLPTTHSRNVDGVLVCYTLFERLGISASDSTTVEQLLEGARRVASDRTNLSPIDREIIREALSLRPIR